MLEVHSIFISWCFLTFSDCIYNVHIYLEASCSLSSSVGMISPNISHIYNKALAINNSFASFSFEFLTSDRAMQVFILSVYQYEISR